MSDNTTLLEKIKTEIMRDIYEKQLVFTSIHDKPDGWIWMSSDNGSILFAGNCYNDFGS